MSTAKSGDQGAEAGDVFVESSEKTGIRDFGFCEQRGSPVLQGRKRLRDEECGSGDQRMAVWPMLHEIRKSKMEIPGKMMRPVWRRGFSSLRSCAAWMYNQSGPRCRHCAPGWQQRF